MRRPSFYASLLGLFLAVASHAAERPKVGLVLGGGGARGAAHIGVLEVLEQMRIPVDCVAGTSMGALVAGAWGAGLDAASMRRALGNADWKDMFQDNPGYSEFSYRNKIMLQRFLPGSETGINAQGAFTPPGVVLGQKIKLFFNQLVHADAGERLIETLPLPVSMIATDIATGERVVYRDGSLTLAMRASMSVPGLMAPLEYRGRKLVDGSLVDNVPIREVRERCGAEVIIAVNVGSPLMSAQEISGLLSVSAQMVAILTEQNVTQSLATLTPADVYIKPDLTGVGAADFERNGEAANRGHAAAIAVSGQLQKLSVDAASYAAWRARWAPSVQQAPRVDEIDIAGLLRVNPAAVTRHVQQQVGRALDTATLNRDLMRVYGEGDFERVDYSLLRQNDRNVLRITPIEKSWGPDYLRLGMNLSSSWNSDAVFSLRAAYQRTWMNALGGELLLAGELGNSSGLSAEWHQPLDLDQRYFADAQVQSRRESTLLYVDNARISEYRQQYRRIELAVGTNWGLAGQVRLGWREDERVLRLDTGLPLLPTDSLRTSGPVLTLDLDQLDQIYLPSKGWSVRASWFESARADYNRVSVGLNRVYPLDNWVVGLRATHTGATYGELPVQDMAKLGGFLNLSGFAQGQLSGDQVSYAHIRGERILGRMPLGLRGDIRLGFALEAGKVGVPVSEPSRSGWLNSALVYAGGETPLGPVYVGVGRSSTGSTNAYVFIGTP
jgi:NTE family protein